MTADAGAGGAFADAFTKAMTSRQTADIQRQQLEQQQLQFESQQQLEREKLATETVAANRQTARKNYDTMQVTLDGLATKYADAVKNKPGFRESNAAKVMAEQYKRAVQNQNAFATVFGLPKRDPDTLITTLGASAVTPQEARQQAALDAESQERAKIAPAVERTEALADPQAQAAAAMERAKIPVAVERTEALAGPEAQAAAQKKRAEEQVKLEGAQARLNAMLDPKLSPERKRQLTALLGGDVQTDSFFRVMEALETETDPEKRELLLKRANILTENTGFGIAFKDGKVVAVGTGAGLETTLTGLKPQQRLAAVQKLKGIEGDVNFTQRLIDLATEQPNLFGVQGSLRNSLQNLIQGGEELAGLVPGLEAVVQNIREQVKDQDSNIIAQFDPNLSGMELLENSLAFRLARLRMERGGSEVRALSAVMKDAKKDVSLTGFTTTASVLARLNKIQKQFKDEFEAQKQAVNEPVPETTNPQGGVKTIRFDKAGNRIP